MVTDCGENHVATKQGNANVPLSDRRPRRPFARRRGGHGRLINLPAGPYKLDATGKCHAANGKFVVAKMCKAPAAAKHCRDPKTGKFAKCGTAGAVPALGGLMADKTEVTVKLTKVEALALVNAVETGLRVIEALGLVKNTATMEEAVRKLRAAT